MTGVRAASPNRSAACLNIARGCPTRFRLPFFIRTAIREFSEYAILRGLENVLDSPFTTTGPVGFPLVRDFGQGGGFRRRPASSLRASSLQGFGFCAGRYPCGSLPPAAPLIPPAGAEGRTAGSPLYSGAASDSPSARPNRFRRTVVASGAEGGERQPPGRQ